ncbi:MAG TPA: hypothetical protein VMT38_11795 [Terracidiphilus sp.]|nr:hypothetical protein [Terracidiphilus sp.]
MSLHRSFRLWIKAAALVAPAALVSALPAPAQYPGQIAKPDTNAPDMRAVAVYEYTGDESHPKAARMVPVCIFDGQQLNDAGVYLAQPEPLALESDVEYQLQRDGKPIGIFDIDTSAREQGGWVGYGKWHPMPKPKATAPEVAKVDADDDAQSDVPILHRKQHADDSSGGSNSGSGSGSTGPAPDPDRPTLHKAGDTSNSGSDSTSGSATDSTDSNAPAPDSDRPTLHRSDDSSSSAGASSDDSSRPKLKKKKKDSDDDAYVADVATASDPSRPHLVPGKFAGYGAAVVPTLFGFPVDMKQNVAVSDATDRPEHLWNYTWANPGDEDKMKAAMEDLARTALGLNPPAAPAKSKSTAARRRTQPVTPLAPAPLLVEQFRVFQLAYDAGATLVLSAHTDGTGTNEKFVTLIAQPDLYGGVDVLVKNVTDAASLDLTPRMRLIDAVDAEADNRGELLFELRGDSQRQFALYRVLRGQATRIFVSSPESIGLVAVDQ